MYVRRHLVGQQPVDHPLPLHPGFPREGPGRHGDPEMALAAGPCPRVPGMAIGFVDDLKP